MGRPAVSKHLRVLSGDLGRAGTPAGTGMTILRRPGSGRAGEAARLAAQDDPLGSWQVMLEA